MSVPRLSDEQKAQALSWSGSTFRELLETTDDAERQRIVSSVGQSLPAKTELELVCAANHAVSLTLGNYIALVDGLRRHSPLAEDLVQRFLKDNNQRDFEEIVAGLIEGGEL